MYSVRSKLSFVNPIGIDALIPQSNIDKRKCISYMPRKNNRDSDIVTAIASSCFPDWQFLPYKIAPIMK